jgi:hypothetical protein
METAARLGYPGYRANCSIPKFCDAPAERMRMMRERRRGRELRELRLVVPDPRLESVRKRVAVQLARLDRSREDEALSWIKAVAEFDMPGSRERTLSTPPRS